MDLPNKVPMDLTDLELPRRKIKFIGSYCSHGNPERALREADLCEKDASDEEIHLHALAVLNEDNVREGIRRFTAMTLAPFRDIVHVKLLRYLEARAFYTARDFFDDDGKVKTLDQLSPEALMVLDGITEDFKGKDADRRTVKFTLASRSEAFKLLRDLLKETEPKKVDDKGDDQQMMDDLTSAFARLDKEVEAHGHIFAYKEGLRDANAHQIAEVLPKIAPGQSARKIAEDAEIIQPLEEKVKPPVAQPRRARNVQTLADQL